MSFVVCETQEKIKIWPVALHGSSMSFMTVPHQISFLSLAAMCGLPIPWSELSHSQRILVSGEGDTPTVISRTKPFEGSNELC